MLLMLSAAPPVLVSVMFWPELVLPNGCDPNDRPALGARDTTGTVPVPLRATDCRPPLELSVITTEAVRAPWAVGANETLIVQPALGAIAAGQLFVSLKSPAYVPLTEML